MGIRVALYYVVTWVFLMALGGVQQETGLLPPEIGLAQWGPGLAALLMIVLFRKQGPRLQGSVKGIAPERWRLALLPLAVGLVVWGLTRLLPLDREAIPGAYDNLALVIAWMPLGALGEEIGWRGYLHKLLDERWPGLASSALVGVLWAAIHVQLYSQGALVMALFALTAIAWSIVMLALVREGGFPVWLATLFHLAINVVNLLILDVIYQPAFMAINAAVWGLVAAIVVFGRRDLYLARR